MRKAIPQFIPQDRIPSNFLVKIVLHPNEDTLSRRLSSVLACGEKKSLNLLYVIMSVLMSIFSCVSCLGRWRWWWVWWGGWGVCTDRWWVWVWFRERGFWGFWRLVCGGRWWWGGEGHFTHKKHIANQIST